MVRRGSTVRVRQRALQKRRIWRFFFRILLRIFGTWTRYGAPNGAFRPGSSDSATRLSDRPPLALKARPAPPRPAPHHWARSLSRGLYRPVDHAGVGDRYGTSTGPGL